ncbi:MAG: NifB/NifX family molybdenum-iron cluster-binding protein [Thermodesulfobacteriota bacterium]|nr:NifB/NifX family molybdenum-iron cluster-binding protein [Thermodesulfobacteriota bacterium]
MQIAIVSTDGKNVNEHFGRAESFLIYEMGEDGLTMIGETKTAPLSVGDQSHQFNQEHFDLVVNALGKCSRVYCTRIGDRPRQELEKLGIMPVIYAGVIEGVTLSHP